MRMIASVLLAAMFLAAPNAVVAQANCGPREKILEAAILQYKELPTARAVTAGNRLLEVLTSPDGETWTVIISHPNGMSCIMATGEGWENFDYEAPSQGS